MAKITVVKTEKGTEKVVAKWEGLSKVPNSFFSGNPVETEEKIAKLLIDLGYAVEFVAPVLANQSTDDSGKQKE